MFADEHLEAAREHLGMRSNADCFMPNQGAQQKEHVNIGQWGALNIASHLACVGVG